MSTRVSPKASARCFCFRLPKKPCSMQLLNSHSFSFVRGQDCSCPSYATWPVNYGFRNRLKCQLWIGDVEGAGGENCVSAFKTVKVRNA